MPKETHIVVGMGSRIVKISSKDFEFMFEAYAMNVFQRASDSEIAVFDTEKGTFLSIMEDEESARDLTVLREMERYPSLHPEAKRPKRKTPPRYVEIPCLEHRAGNNSEKDEHSILSNYLDKIEGIAPENARA
jgi:hypothetical protein